MYTYIFTVQIFTVIFMFFFSENKKKTVHYLIAKDGNPWVWVIDDDLDSKAKGTFYRLIKNIVLLIL